MMGSGGGKTEIERSPLEKKQKEILDSREAFYQSTIQPELLEFFEATKNFELNKDFEAPSASQLASQQVNTLNQSYGQAGEQLQRSLAQRGLSGSGVEAGSLALLGGAQAEAVGGAVNQAQLQSMMQRNQVISQQNALEMQEQNVYGSGFNALAQQGPRPTGSIGTSYTQQSGGGMNPWLGAGLGLAGSALGGPMGGMIGTGIAGMFSGGGGAGAGAGASTGVSAGFLK
jgi:hypothetical protein